MKKKLVLVLWVVWAFFSLFLAFDLFNKDSEGSISTHSLGEEMRVMSWNLGSYCQSSRYFEGTYYKNSPKPEKQRKAIAKAIANTNPDVLCVQELGCDNLNLFKAELNLQNINYPYYALLKKLDEKRCIAILSKIPFDKLKKYDKVKFPYENSTFESVRGLLLVKIGDIFIATLHAKSKREFEKYPNDKECAIYRKAELASFTKILAHYKGEKLLLCGDFNEEPSHPNIKNFELKANLSLVAQGTSPSDSWTYSYKSGKYTNIFDYFLATPKLGIKKPAQILVDYKQASDHRAVYIDIPLN